MTHRFGTNPFKMFSDSKGNKAGKKMKPRIPEKAGRCG